MSVTSPHVPNEGPFPNQIASGEVADQGRSLLFKKE